jgi:6-phosphogluconolactonase
MSDGGPDGAAGTGGMAGAGGMADAGSPAPDAVYTLSNDPNGNQILAYTRDATSGALSAAGTYATGGKGSGAGLGSQGALVFDKSQNRFFAVNAGDNTISMLALQDDGTLKLESNVDSGGVDPVSIAVHGSTVYVVNAGDATTPSNISGFQIAAATLKPLANSSLALSTADAGPAQIEFNADGSLLIVTEKKTNKIDTYTMSSGVASGPIAHPSNGQTPFGFALSAHGQLVVSEAFGGTAGKSAVSSYSLGTAKSGLAGVSASVPSGQSAACWVAVQNDFAYVTNAKTNNLSAYKIASDGSLAYQWSANTGTGPIDEALTPSNDYLYVLNSGDHSLSVFGVNDSTGALAPKPAYTGLPSTAAGVVASSKTVYTMSNDATANEIDAYLRAADGSLAALGSYATGGKGTGAGLGSQGAVALDAQNSRLFVVNAGDNSLSMMALESDGSVMLDSHVDAGGVDPVSVTVHGNTVYVVNTGDGTTPANISGFSISGTALNPIADSSRPLSADDAGPAQIQFNADGSLLIVTEKETNLLDTYTLDASGVADGPNAYPSLGQTPFGFAFSQGGQVVVSEAFGGMAGESATSSYAIGTTGSLSSISSSVPSGQSAACWVAVAGNYAYVTNAKTDNLSAYQVAANGGLSYLWSASTGMGPIDESVSGDGKFLYVLDAGDQTFSIYGIDQQSGLLMQKTAFTGLPASAAGVVAR